METGKRTLAKALSWQAVGLLSMTALGYVFTGSVSASGRLALLSAAIGAGAYVVHERLWAAIRWGRGNH